MAERPNTRPTGNDPASSLDPAVWVDEHGDYLFRYALFRMRDRQRAEDAVQETFLAAIKAKDSFTGKSSVRTWLVGILKHKVIDHYRKTSRESSLDAVEDPDALIERSFNRREHWARGGPVPSSWGRKPDQAMEDGEFWQAFSDCLKGLPEKTGRGLLHARAGRQHERRNQ